MNFRTTLSIRLLYHRVKILFAFLFHFIPKDLTSSDLLRFNLGDFK